MNIQPDEGHVLKAMAWDTMYYAFSIQAETSTKKADREQAVKWMAVMNENLDNIGNAMSKPGFWDKEET